MQAFKSQEIKSALKLLAKRKGLTYEDLAEKLECSVPTVKRYLGHEDLPLSRLLQFCDLLEVSLTEVELLTTSKPKAEEKFSAEQEQFLVKNRGHFAYLAQLFEGLSPSQIATKFSLTQKSNDKYLIALERQGLIRVTGTQKVKPVFNDIPHLGDGPLGRAYYRSLIECASKFFITAIDRDIRMKQSMKPAAGAVGSRYSIMKMTVTKETYREWTKQQEEALRNLSNLSQFEEKSRPKSELQTMVVTGGHTLVASDLPELAVLEGVFGEIKNIS